MYFLGEMVNVNLETSLYLSIDCRKWLKIK